MNARFASISSRVARPVVAAAAMSALLAGAAVAQQKPAPKHTHPAGKTAHDSTKAHKPATKSDSTKTPAGKPAKKGH